MTVSVNDILNEEVNIVDVEDELKELLSIYETKLQGVKERLNHNGYLLTAMKEFIYYSEEKNLLENKIYSIKQKMDAAYGEDEDGE